MIRKISEKILNYLINSKVISDTEDNRDYFQYGIEITISSLLNIILILGIGIVTHSMIESIIFLICFILLRQFTGGFHADTYFKCNLSFCIVFSIVLVLYYTTAQYLSTYISILITFVCVSIILAKCPIEHINKPIPNNRKIIHKILAALLGAVYGAMGTVLTAFSNRYGALVIYTLSLVTALILAAIIKERWDKHESNKENK
ncbi:MAG: accessory gene regulator B family protein [Ruminococcus flavefaciens]|nr:accessory gene regulator B family protein [Ruminococcus flavefaciens]MCM1061931.1 accessory gene regulator B family protein [Eubacterium sp.]